MPTIYKPKKAKKKEKKLYEEERRKIYKSTRWRKLRALKIAEQPLCEMCLKEGKTTIAEDVHHIESFMSTDDPMRRMALAYDYENLMSICKTHHQMIHNKSNRNDIKGGMG
ncbi:HNH endonuclease [uncultured Bacteroides sp.]|uniref:HNH endonuclease signature motif containing protein n=1 Tax=uncultured Bacteroides sp. TaxID=162156 RepID=UPI0027D933D6|nr:HNH endonuclease [uncultured Bacteroides sp.]